MCIAGRLGLVAALVACVMGTSLPVAAKEYVVVGSYGNKLHLVDPVALKVVRTYDVPGPATGPTEITPSPDGRVVYVVTNRWMSVSGIDLDSGKEVFRADLATDEVRVHALFGLDISPDGKSLYVYEQRARKKLDRFEGLDPAIAVYRTDAGTTAKPERMINAPRQVQQIAVSTDGRTIYAQGIDIYAIDVASGTVRETIPVAHWKRAGYGPAESMAWLGEQLNASGMYAMAFYAEKTGTAGTAPVAQDADPPARIRDAGVLSINLKTGASEFDVVGPESDMPQLASMSANPQNPHEVFGLGAELFKVDLVAKRVVAHAPTNALLFYVIAVSGDGQKIYAGGGHCRVGVYETKDLSTIGIVELPNCAVMGQSSLRIVNRP